MKCFLAVGWVLLATIASAAERPNVLFIVADDLNCAVGPYGDEVAVTPHLDRLAARGMVFQNAYCQQAVCNPSRSSFLTGLRPDTVKVDDLRKGFRDTAPGGSTLITLPQHFKNHGYFCQNIGKIFHNMGETQDRRSWSIDEVLYKGTHAADTVYTNTPPALRKSVVKKAPVTESLDVPDTAYRDGQIANLASAMLRDHPADGQPFFLAVGFWRPHLPFVAPKKYWDLYSPEEIPPADPPAAPVGVPEIAMHDSREIRGYGGAASEGEFTIEQTRHYRHGYYASISFMDAQIGQILDALDEGGHTDDTIVVFTSDHGFHIGEQTLWGKTTNFELDARVPLIIADPNHPSGQGKSTTALAELVDLYPTLASLAGISRDLNKRLEGVDLTPVVADPMASIKDAAFTQHQHPFYGSPNQWKAWGYSIRTDRWRYTQWRAIDTGQMIAEELYDHSTDPRETENVAARNPEIVGSLSTRLAKQFGMATVASLQGAQSRDAKITLTATTAADERALKEAVGDRFRIGVGVSHVVLQDPNDAALIKKHFQILTPENCMKPQSIHPAEDQWNFGDTDRFAEFTRSNDLEMVGHCLVWAKDDRTDPWMMQEDGEPVSRETLLRRIDTHIATVVRRYADVTSMWDVVNEAIGDSDAGLLRDSVYSRTCGIDFIVAAFQAARKHDPDALLIYNDYNGHKPGKREKLIELLTQLKQRGAPVDAYGMQGHFELGDDSLGQLRETFDELRKLKIKVVVSELDIDVVTRGRWWADGGKYRDELASFDPYKDGLPESIEQQEIDQYVELFKLFDEYRDVIERVSFWNLHDGQSWLNYFPWQRVNYPLLFDRNRRPKRTFDAVYDFLTATR